MRGLLRALFARCPICGSKGIWKSFGQTVDNCPRCGYRYAREPGYWTGGLIVNIGVAILLFFLIFVGGMLLTWPHVPWTALQIASLVAVVLGPWLLYPQSKTIWVWLDLKVHPYEHGERDWGEHPR
jgi:uncharacterized protein (DUF983 family)